MRWSHPLLAELIMSEGPFQFGIFDLILHAVNILSVPKDKLSKVQRRQSDVESGEKLGGFWS